MGSRLMANVASGELSMYRITNYPWELLWGHGLSADLQSAERPAAP